MTQAAALLLGIGAPDGGAAETVIAVSNVPVTSNPNPARPTVNPAVRITGIIVATPPAGATSCSIRVRKGTTTAGANVFPNAIFPVTAGITNSFPFYCVDTTGESEKVGGLQYNVTIQYTGAVGTSTANVVGILEILDPTP